MNPVLKEFQDKMDTDLSPIIAPLENNGVGEDPKYCDEYIYIKTEIDKFSNTDYSEITRACEQILSTISKDLRVAGYLILAKTYTEGAEGLIEASEIYLYLMERYGEHMHPQRESARLQTFAWLNNEKLLAFFDSYLSSNQVPFEAICHLQEIIEKINQKAIEVFGQEVMRWSILNELIAKELKNTSPAENKTEESEVDIHIVKKESSHISTEMGFLKSSTELIDYLIRSDDWLRAIAISRAMRWTTMILPTNVEGATKLTAPRDSVIAQVKSEVEENDHIAQLWNNEQYFLEAGGQYWLDLQYKSALIARTNNMIALAELIEEQTSHLTTKLPQLHKLSYIDGTPFADNKTRQWLKRISTKQEMQPVENSIKHSDTDPLLVQLNTIRRESVETGMESALQKIAEIKVSSDSERFYVDMTRIDVCVENDRLDLALYLAEALNKKVKKYKLDEWDPSLAIQVWRRLRDLLYQAQPGDKVMKRIRLFEEKICELDMSTALGII